MVCDFVCVFNRKLSFVQYAHIYTYMQIKAELSNPRSWSRLFLCLCVCRHWVSIFLFKHTRVVIYRYLNVRVLLPSWRFKIISKSSRWGRKRWSIWRRGVSKRFGWYDVTVQGREWMTTVMTTIMNDNWTKNCSP